MKRKIEHFGEQCHFAQTNEQLFGDKADFGEKEEIYQFEAGVNESENYLKDDRIDNVWEIVSMFGPKTANFQKY